MSASTYKEYCFELCEALKNRGKFEAELKKLQEEKSRWFRAALLAKWFSEGRYSKWASYFMAKASICNLKVVIANNERKITALESRIATFGVTVSTESEPETVDAEEVSDDDDPNITFFQNDGLNAD
jgi:hypothetical protein